MTTKDKIKYGIQGFGALLFLVCLGAWIWSLTQPAVTTGPMPDPWKTPASAK